MPFYTDQFNIDVNLPSVPKRIISVVPSQTELLFYLGLEEEIIGVTKFCIHPEDKFRSATKIGGTKQLDIDKIKLLNPDLIIANKEENERSQLGELMQHFPVWISDIYKLDDALEMIEAVGKIVDREEAALTLSRSVTKKFNALQATQSGLRTAYFIWRKPYMVAGKSTFIDDMLQKCGLVNAFDFERYPEINTRQLQQSKPDVILLSSEPYPFKEKHLDELKAIVPSAKILLVDGEMFSWYGNRLLKAPSYFAGLIKRLTINQ